MVKVCIYNPRIRCFWISCSFLDDRGNVVLCWRHRNSRAFFTPKTRKVVISHE